MSRRPARPAAFPSRDEILKFVQDSPGRLTRRDIARAFRIRGDARAELRAVLRGLSEEGLIEKERGGALAAGRLPSVLPIEVSEIDADGELWAKPLSWKGDAPPPRILLVPDQRRTRVAALGVGDRVLARLRAVEDGVYEARVMRAIGNEPDRVIGIFDLVEGQGRIRPTQRRHKAEYAVTGADSMGAAPGELVAAQVLPSRRLGLRQARIEERLGKIGGAKSLSLIAIHNHGIRTEFDRAVLAEAEGARVPGLDKRTDLRKVPLITIDPEDARDFDDAVWAAPDDDPANAGGWNIIVAIADVAHYVRPGNALDREAFQRGNSVYFPDRVEPMLPEALSAGVCSLRPDVVRACLAVRIRIDAEGNKLGHEFVRGLMRSAGRLTYRQAQDAKDGRPTDVSSQLTGSVLAPLYAAHGALAKARKTRGPLDLELPERRARFGDDGEVLAIELREHLHSHRLIEDFMILANVCAAETLERQKTACMYRVHDEPGREKLSALGEFLGTLGYNLAKGQVMKPAALNGILRKAKGSPHETVVNQVILRAQAQALYSPDNHGHFGLALRRYAHFTSPIRRYADLLIHRALISGGRLGAGGLDAAQAQDFAAIGEKISGLERTAMAAEREAMDRFSAAFMVSKVGTELKGAISGVSRFGLFITLDDSGADGLIPLRTLGREYFRHEEHLHSLVGEETGVTYRLGDRVDVRLAEADAVSGRLRLEMLSDDAPRGRANVRGRRHQRQRGRRKRRN
ncbi:MAG: ribonuclease R [Proteobacteria bacterium]|nr:ribonuclease R [Pseudomonadota bacterium]